MSYADPEEENTLETFFDRGNFTPGGETNQLRDACAAVERFVAQEMCGNLANTPTLDELWIHFQAILLRIFGDQDAATAAPAGGAGSSSGVYGGFEHSWMFAATSFYAVPNPAERHSSGGGRGPAAHRDSKAADPRLAGMEVMAIPLLSLLLARPPDQASRTAKNLFGVLLEPHKVWYKFSCKSPPMPPHSLALLRHEARPDAVLLENVRLYTHCLSSPPSVFPQGFVARPGVRFLDGPGGGAVDGEVASLAARVAPDLSLSTLEFYLFTFAWYALSSSVDFYSGLAGPGQMPPVQYRGRDQVNFRPERVALGWRSNGTKGLTQKNPYMTLLLDYIEAFFPHENGMSICGDNGGGSGGMGAQRELLLRVLVEFWLEGNTVLRPGVLKEEEQQLLLQLQQAQAWGNNSMINSGNGTATATATATATTRISGNYDPTIPVLGSEFVPPTDTSLHGLLVVSAHLLADPWLRELCGLRLRAAAGARSETPSAAAGAAVGGGDGKRTALTPALEVLRPHVFGFLRVMFSPESTVHTSSATFSLVVELWMLWMRPWAAPAILKGGSPESPTNFDAAAGCASSRRGSGPSSSSSSPPSVAATGRGDAASGSETWVTRVISEVKEFLQIEPANSGRGRGSAARTGGTGGGAAGASTAGLGGYCHDPWGGWVLENYSLYTTLLAAFMRKAGSTSYKTNLGSRNGSQGVVNGVVGHVFSDVGGANLKLLHRVAKVFCPGVTSLLASAQNTLRNAKERGGGGGGGGGGRGGGWEGEALSDVELDALEGGRKALASIQGPNLVTLGSYQGAAEELLVTIQDLAYPRVSSHWMDRLEQWFIGRDSDKTTQRAREISIKVKELFGLPTDWKPKGLGDQGGGAPRGAEEVAKIFHPDRDAQAPFFLSQQGKAQIVGGRSLCRPWDVAYVGDPMYCPRRAWELEVLVDFWTRLSESVNAYWLGWTPVHGEAGEGSLVDEPLAFDDEGPSKAIARGKEFQRRVWREGRWAKLPRRVNLRPLADVRATLGLVLALIFLLLACYMSLTCGAIFATLLVALAVRLSVME